MVRSHHHLQLHLEVQQVDDAWPQAHSHRPRGRKSSLHLHWCRQCVDDSSGSSPRTLSHHETWLVVELLWLQADCPQRCWWSVGNQGDNGEEHNAKVGSCGKSSRLKRCLAHHPQPWEPWLVLAIWFWQDLLVDVTPVKNMSDQQQVVCWRRHIFWGGHGEVDGQCQLVEGLTWLHYDASKHLQRNGLRLSAQGWSGLKSKVHWPVVDTPKAIVKGCSRKLWAEHFVVALCRSRQTWFH